jgi:hypothetical protein
MSSASTGFAAHLAANHPLLSETFDPPEETKAEVQARKARADRMLRRWQRREARRLTLERYAAQLRRDASQGCY